MFSDDFYEEMYASNLTGIARQIARQIDERVPDPCSTVFHVLKKLKAET